MKSRYQGQWRAGARCNSNTKMKCGKIFMYVADKWKDYELLDCGDGQRLERWGDYKIIRPDPQAIWTKSDASLWRAAHGKYTRASTGGGSWDKNALPDSWNIAYGDLKFGIKPMNFKHTGVFPEQAANWDFAMDTIKRRGTVVNVLNLFGYTGAATIAAASAGASVCHVDAARGMVAWAKENAKLSGLGDAPIRYIVDDCKKFVEREITRGKKYDAIIMDPPSYGRGPNGEIWKFEDNIYEFVKLCMGVLSENPLFIIINSYTTGISPSVPVYILGSTVGKKYGGEVEGAELGIPVKSTGLNLPCGHTARWIGR